MVEITIDAEAHQAAVRLPISEQDRFRPLIAETAV